MNKINIAELLKHYPKGMELDCIICNGVKFIELDRSPNFPIVVRANNGYEFSLTKYGQVLNIDEAKCVIFPKGKNTWEGFVPPCKFKDGDILFVKSVYSWVLVYKESENNENLYRYVAILYNHNHTYTVYDNIPLCCKEDVSEIRLATEEEKQKLFDAIKANGYKWNAETKTLEKLPKFKVGDVIQDIDTYKVKITEVNIEDGCYEYESIIAKGIGSIPFSEQDNWELVPNKFDITTLVPFESRVLVRSGENCFWKPAIFGFYSTVNFYMLGGIAWSQCIPYEENEHLLGTTNDCNEFYKTWE